MKDRHSKEEYRRRIRKRVLRQKNRKKLATIAGASVLALAIFAGLAWWILTGKASSFFDGFQKAQQTVTIPEGEGFSVSLCIASPESIPAYDGADYIVLTDGTPSFNLYDLKNMEGEHYADLDNLGRCGPAVAMLHRSMMPTEERGEIGQVKPSGWAQRKYPGVIPSSPPYLYHRSHLIAYALTGQNANEKNLITGTCHFNTESMLPFEIQVMQYLEKSENHVLYRVTPFFQGDERLARGVEMEAFSVEDFGKGLCYHVFVYNVQPGIEIDYETGESHEKNPSD